MEPRTKIISWLVLGALAGVTVGVISQLNDLRINADIYQQTQNQLGMLGGTNQSTATSTNQPTGVGMDPGQMWGTIIADIKFTDGNSQEKIKEREKLKPLGKIWISGGLLSQGSEINIPLQDISGLNLGQFPPGKYSLSAGMIWYVADSQTVEVTMGQKSTAVINLKPNYASAKASGLGMIQEIKDGKLVWIPNYIEAMDKVKKMLLADLYQFYCKKPAPANLTGIITGVRYLKFEFPLSGPGDVTVKAAASYLMNGHLSSQCN